MKAQYVCAVLLCVSATASAGYSKGRSSYNYNKQKYHPRQRMTTEETVANALTMELENAEERIDVQSLRSK